MLTFEWDGLERIRKRIRHATPDSARLFTDGLREAAHVHTLACQVRFGIQAPMDTGAYRDTIGLPGITNIYYSTRWKNSIFAHWRTDASEHHVTGVFRLLPTSVDYGVLSRYAIPWHTGFFNVPLQRDFGPRPALFFDNLDAAIIKSQFLTWANIGFWL